MSLFTKAVRLYQDVTSVGGTYRIRAASKRYFVLRENHAHTVDRLSRYNAELSETRGEIQRLVEVSGSHLRMAERMLKYSPGGGLYPVLSPAVAESAEVKGGLDDPFTPRPATSMKTSTPSIAGTTTGAAASVGAWATAEVLAHSAAGTAPGLSIFTSIATALGITTLRNSTVATGSAMVASSPLLLTGIGAIVGVAVSSKISHTRANKITDVCHQLEQMQNARATDLVRLRAEVETLEQLEAKLNSEDQELWKAISASRRVLFPLGMVSHFWRLLRTTAGGKYYEPRELPLVDHLNETVNEFVAAFKRTSSIAPPAMSAPSKPARRRRWALGGSAGALLPAS